MSLLIIYGVWGVLTWIAETIKEEIYWHKKRKEFAARRPKPHIFC